MIKLELKKDDLCALLYEMANSNDITVYTLLGIALNHIPDYEIDNFVRAIIMCKQTIARITEKHKADAKA